MSLYHILLYTHIIAGSLGLLLGTITAIRKKADKTHKKIGFYFYTSMTIASLVAMPLSYIHPNLFLFFISVVTLYALITGKRYIAKTKDDTILTIDWIISGIMALFALSLIGYGAYMFFRGESFGFVPIVFGFFSLSGVYEDWQNFTGRSKFSNPFLTTHISRISGAYIASLTAFLVVNNTILPNIIAWLLPTIVMTPIIVRWIRNYGKLKPIE